MSKALVMDLELARSAAHDAANRSMRAGGRKKWNYEDWNAACAEFNRLWPEGSNAIQVGSAKPSQNQE